MPEAVRAGDPATLAVLRDRILNFVAACRQPVLKEDGCEPLVITPDRFQLEPQSNSLLLEAWDDSRTVTRRVTALRSGDARRLVLTFRKFGGREGEIVLTDTSLRGAALDRNLSRKNHAERFRALLARQFPGWTIDKLKADRDLHRSFSEHYVRARVARGATAWAAIGVSEAEGTAAAAGILTDGILWLDHLREITTERVVSGLCLFVPQDSTETTANRLAFLDPERAAYQLFPVPPTNLSETPEDALPPVNPADYGNLRTELHTPRLTANIAPEAREHLRPIAAFPGVEEEVTARGELSLRFRGLEVAHADALSYNLAGTPLSEIARLRAPDPPDRHHPLFTRSAERWLESILKADLSPLALELAGGPVYSQTHSDAGLSRGIIDLLTVTNSGRLVVIELKADEDPQLPLQALDYWMRVRWHQERGDFARHGYFPGRTLAPDPPLLWLVFPSLRLHAANEVVLKYLAKHVPISRLGINEDWRKGVHVVYRA